MIYWDHSFVWIFLLLLYANTVTWQANSNTQNDQFLLYALEFHCFCLCTYMDTHILFYKCSHLNHLNALLCLNKTLQGEKNYEAWMEPVQPNISPYLSFISFFVIPSNLSLFGQVCFS